MSDRDLADQATGHDPEFYEHCAHCDSSFSEGEWHPVVPDFDDGTVVALYSFCNDACQIAWATEQ